MTAFVARENMVFPSVNRTLPRKGRLQRFQQDSCLGISWSTHQRKLSPQPSPIINFVPVLLQVSFACFIDIKICKFWQITRYNYANNNL